MKRTISRSPSPERRVKSRPDSVTINAPTPKKKSVSIKKVSQREKRGRQISRDVEDDGSVETNMELVSPAEVKKPKVKPPDDSGKTRRKVKKEEVAPKSINLRKGLSIRDKPTTPQKKRERDAALRLVYSDNLAILKFSKKTVDTSEDLFAGKRPEGEDPPLRSPAVLNSELSSIHVREITNVNDKQQLDALLEKYKETEDPVGYIAALIHHADFYPAKADLIALYKVILTRHTSSSVISKESLGLLPKRYDKNKQKLVKDNLQEIKQAIIDFGTTHPQLPIISADYTDKDTLNNINALFEKALEADDWKQLAALSDYANTLYAQFRDAMQQPWDIFTNTNLGGTTNDSPEGRLAAIYAAQLALANLPTATFTPDRPVYRWLEGVENHQVGDLISALALYSASTGTQSSDVFAGKGDRTLFVIKAPKSGKFIQLLAGTKNWYQREVLFPTYTQFVVRRKQQPGDNEVWFLLEELDDSITQVTADVIPGIGMLVDDIEQAYTLSNELLTNTLVDQRHRLLFNQVNRPSLQELTDAGVELSKDVQAAAITLNNIYGAATHVAWGRLMQATTKRRELLTEATLKRYLGQLKGVANPNYRTEEKGWGADNYYPPLNQKQRAALDEHGLRYYPTITQAQKRQFLKWLTELGNSAQISTTKGTREAPEWVKVSGYKQIIQADTRQRIAINEQVAAEFAKWKKQKYNADTQEYEVSYGESDVIAQNIDVALSITSTGLEQALALYIDKKITTEVYRERVQRYAANLQQELAAIHPFNDGNGRLSRLMMYKILQAYLPTADTNDPNKSLPVIADPGQDLLMTKDEWHAHVFGVEK
jgi:Fic/DOC family